VSFTNAAWGFGGGQVKRTIKGVVRFVSFNHISFRIPGTTAFRAEIRRVLKIKILGDMDARDSKPRIGLTRCGDYS
jgi:hypothetical protein